MTQQCAERSAHSNYCYRYKQTWLKDEHGFTRDRWVFGPIVVAIALMGILLFVAPLSRTPIPHEGDRRTQVYECHPRSTVIIAGKTIIPITQRSCGWRTVP